MKSINPVLLILIGLMAVGCFSKIENTEKELEPNEKSGIELIVLGTLQDGGSPHLGCLKSCCAGLAENPDPSRKVVSLGIVDYDAQETYLFEASPDFESQVRYLQSQLGNSAAKQPSGIFLSHAHIGHYTGLVHLGREVMNAQSVPTYVMPKMSEFLKSNGPWSQLHELNNIQLRTIQADSVLQLSPRIKIKPLVVPHRDEFSETIGFLIDGPNKRVLFIPDIDKWSKWERSITELIQEVDYAFLDATFYGQNELPNRAISEVPHPFVSESMDLFSNLDSIHKRKVYFIHLNHTNPLLVKGSEERMNVEEAGFNLAKFHQVLAL